MEMAVGGGVRVGLLVGAWVPRCGFVGALVGASVGALVVGRCFGGRRGCLIGCFGGRRGRYCRCLGVGALVGASVGAWVPPWVPW